MPVKTDREYRDILCPMELRTAEDGKMTVEGYATTFNQPYEMCRAKGIIAMEQVDPHAFDECDMSDVIMQYDHEGRVFARLSNGTLQLNADEHGLRVIADLGGTTLGRQLYEEIEGGYTNKMSFGFTVAGDGDSRSHTRDADGNTVITRTIRKISKLFDVSAVSLPANSATEISTRKIGDGLIAEAEEEIRAEEEQRAEEERRSAALEKLNKLISEVKTNE